jgi:outer membrane protein/protease secretion system outer membrane protein
MVAQWSNSLNDQVTNLNSAYKVASVGFQLNLPLYSGGYMSSVERQASAQYVNARELHEAGLRDLGLRVQKEYRGVTEGLLRIHALEQAVRSAKVALDSASKSYAAGSRTLLNVLDAENALSIAEQNLAQARYAYLAARLRLGALAGEGPVTIDLLNGWLSAGQR